MSQTVTSYPNSHSPTNSWRPMVLSFVAHSLLVVFLLIWGFSNQTPGGEGEPRPAGIVLSVSNDQEETEYLTESDLPDETESDSESESADPVSATPPALAAPIETPDRPELPGVETFEPADFDANQMAEVPVQADTSSQYELSEEDLKLIKADQRLVQSRKPVGNPASISVFGTGNLTGRSFVFVLDRSKSMGGSGLGVIEAARTELTNAINQLEPHHQFQIIGYHERTVTITKRKLLPATEENKKLVPAFIRNLAAFGGTNHENGLVSAIAFRPDVIVLMTDGGYPELNENQLTMFKRMAGRKSSISCIQFGIGSLQNRVNFMTKMAGANSGTFRYIDVNEWKKDN